jgi:hypothetical protein
MQYQIQVHFMNKGQYNYFYTPDAKENIDDFLLRFDDPSEAYLLVGDEDTSALITMAHVAAVIAVPVPTIPQIIPITSDIYAAEEKQI